MSDMGRQSMTDKAGAALKVSLLVWLSCMRVPPMGVYQFYADFRRLRWHTRVAMRPEVSYLVLIVCTASLTPRRAPPNTWVTR